MVFEANVVDCGGPLCRISGVGGLKVTSLKKAIEKETGIKQIEQRLLVGAKELSDDDVIDAHSSLGCTSAYVCVSLVRRTAEQKAWLRLCRWEEDLSTELKEAFRRAPESVQADRDCCLAAVQRDGAALQYAAKTLRADLEVVLAAVEHDSTGVAFLHASRDLRANRTIVLAATRSGVAGSLLLREILRSDWRLVFFAAFGMLRNFLNLVELAARVLYFVVLFPVSLAVDLLGGGHEVLGRFEW